MKILVVAPHADDEVLGVGGTIARFAYEGHEVVVAIITGHGEDAPHPLWPRDVWDRVRKEASAAHEILGVASTIYDEIPAAQVAEYPKWRLNSATAELIERVRPEILIVPYPFDLHDDHREIVRSLSVAWRPCTAAGRGIQQILAYETVSETHWGLPNLEPAFTPNYWFDISQWLPKKLDALKCFASQMQEFPHQRSLETIEALAKFRGSQVGMRAAEAFVVLRQTVPQQTAGIHQIGSLASEICDDREEDEGRSVVVIGAGGHAKVTIRTLQEVGYTVEAVFDDDPKFRDQQILGVRVVGTTSDVGKHNPSGAVIAVGNNEHRKRIAKSVDVPYLTVVHPKAFVDKSVRLGRGTVVFAGAVIQPDAVLGEHVIVNTGASIDHDCVIGNFAHIGPGTRLAGEVSVGQRALVGAGAVVIPQGHIGHGSIVGAGSTVTANVGDNQVVAGTPARLIRSNVPAPCDARESSRLSDTEAVSQSELEISSSRNNGKEASSEKARLYLSPPHMGPDERALLLEAFDSNWIAPLGPHVDAFEREFAAKVGAEHAVAVSSGTAALHLALRLLNVGPGDRVATSTLTFAASANAIRYVGAEPLFIDSEADSWNLDPELLAEELEAGSQTGRPIRAVLAVDVCGQCADYDRIQRLCRFYDVPLIEDAAEALGATYGGRPAGSFGDLNCFSFNGNKIITTSGGGMLTTRRADWAERARYLATQARDPAPHYQHSELGYNYRMSNLLAAVGRGQLRVLDERVAARRANFDFYRQTLGNLPGLTFMPEPDECRSTRWLTCVLIDPDAFGATREEVRLALEAENIESRPLWKPMHCQPLYADCRVAGGAVSERLFRDGLCLPSGSNLSEEDLRRVVKTVRGVHRAVKEEVRGIGR